MARARSRGKPNNGQNPVIVISLVMMTILFIGAALTAWSGFAGQAELEKEKAELKLKADLRQKDLNQQKVLRSFWRLLTGYQEGDDVRDLQTYGKEYKEDLDPERKKAADLNIVWENDPKKGGDLPKNPMRAQIVEKDKQIAALKDEIKKLKDGDEKKKVEYESDLALSKKEIQDRIAALDATTKATQEHFANIDKMYKDAMKKLEDAIPDNTKAVEMIKKLEDEKKDLQSKMDAIVAANKKERDRLLEKIGQVDIAAYDKPKGKVFQRNGDTVFLDVGALDFVRPGLTFSVFTPGTYRRDAPRKGSLEVVRNITDHTCEAKITEESLSVRDPILRGDQIFNPVWSPGQKDHVAIAGLIDLTGDGRDNTLEFVRQLEKMGIEVDAYFDFTVAPPALKGNGITRERTSYLIIGEKPNLDQGGGAAQMDARTARKMDVRQEVDKLEKEAIEKGVTTLTARRFMALIGYKVPRINTVDDYFANPVRAAPAKPAEEKKDGEKKEEKKEEKKDPKKEEKKDA